MPLTVAMALSALEVDTWPEMTCKDFYQYSTDFLKQRLLRSPSELSTASSASSTSSASYASALSSRSSTSSYTTTSSAVYSDSESTSSPLIEETEQGLRENKKNFDFFLGVVNLIEEAIEKGLQILPDSKKDLESFILYNNRNILDLGANITEDWAVKMADLPNEYTKIADLAAPTHHFRTCRFKGCYFQEPYNLF